MSSIVLVDISLSGGRNFSYIIVSMHSSLYIMIQVVYYYVVVFVYSFLRISFRIFSSVYPLFSKFFDFYICKKFMIGE